MMSVRRTVVLVAALLLLVVAIHTFSASMVHFTTVTSGTPKDPSAPSFFRIALLPDPHHHHHHHHDSNDHSPDGPDNHAFTSEDERFLSQMLLIGFNVFSMLLIFIRCYYHWILWRRSHRKEVDILKDLRRKAEKKLQDIEEDQKWKFWSQQSTSTTAGNACTKDFAGQSCPICWQEFRLDLTTNDDNGVCKRVDDNDIASEETLLLSPSKPRMVGSDGKPIKSLPCGHAFDYSCAVEWLVTLHKKNMDSPLTCPVCREAF